MKKGFALIALSMSLCAVRALAAQDSSSVVGIVLDAVSSRPIAGATVEIQGLARSVATTARGAFSFSNVPAGEYTIVARAVGYSPFRSVVRVSGRTTVTELPIQLPKTNALDTVVVTDASPEPLAFHEARSLGLGSFMDHSQLAKSGDRRVSDVMVSMRSVGIVQGKAGKAFVMSKRRTPTLRKPPTKSNTEMSRNRPGDDTYYPEEWEERMGVVAGCYARVYLDKQLLNPSTPAEPININDYATRDLVAIEFYASPSSLPALYSNLNSTCGVVVLRTRGAVK